MHRRQTFRALAMASVLLAAPCLAQDADDADAMPALKGALPARPVDAVADPSLDEMGQAESGGSNGTDFAIPPLRASLPPAELRTVVRPVPPGQSASLSARATEPS